MYNHHQGADVPGNDGDHYARMESGYAQGANQQASYQQNFPPISGYGSGRSWEMTYHKNKALYVFNASTETYEDWVEDIFNHLNRTNREWSSILEWVQVQPTDVELTHEALLRTTIKGVSGWDLSTSLDTFMISWLSKGIKKRRKAMSGGVKGDGFELWRQLYHKFKGTGAMTQNVGRRRLHNFGRCNDLSKLSAHLDEWKDQLDEYGAELRIARTSCAR